jgi:hypothetical protein
LAFSNRSSRNSPGAGSEDSGRFVNGILDRVIAELKRPAREAAPRARE